MVVLVNYANEKYYNAQRKNTDSAIKTGGFDKIFEYSPNDIDEVFKKENSKIFSYARGNGLWLWKPYFVNRTLSELEDGDVLVYCDSGAYFTKSINKILKKIKDFDIICFDIPLIEKQFTKSKTFKIMKCEGSEYRDSNQIIGTYFIIKKNKFTCNFVQEWLKYCCNEEILTPSEGETEIESFISHREDQSIFSLLCKKYGIEPYNDISQRYYFPKSYKYDKCIFKKPKHKTIKLPIVLYLHKLPKVTFKSILKNKLRMLKSIFN